MSEPPPEARAMTGWGFDPSSREPATDGSPMENAMRRVLYLMDPTETYRMIRERQRGEELWLYRVRNARAKERARTLLMSLLSDTEQHRYITEKEIIVIGSHGSRYRITEGYSGNVYRMDGQGGAITCYCAHPTMSVNHPEMMAVENAMIAQILAIRNNEQDFLFVANLM